MNSTQSIETQRLAEIAALRDLVHELGTKEKDPLVLGYEDDILELRQYTHGGYRIELQDDDDYKTSSSGDFLDPKTSMVLEFDADLVVTKACIELYGARGGGFTRDIDSSCFGSFVTKLLAGVQDELSREKPAPDEPAEN